MLRKILLLGLVATTVPAVLSVENPGDDPLQWLRDSIPGEPGVDYPIFSSVQETGFSCEGRVFGGYYADVDMGCQAYHVCLLDPLNGGMYPTSFLCPNGTLFQQQIFNCDWWYNVDCASSQTYYGLAEAAFGNNNPGDNNGNGNGQCPNINPLSDSQCFGVESNCWSPGQNDIDCPNYGLCCYDGCANRCVDGPSVDVGSRPISQTSRPRPISQTSRPRPIQTTFRPIQTTQRPFVQQTTQRPTFVQQTTFRPQPIQTTFRPRPIQTTFRPRPVQTTPAIRTTTGYDYPVPDVTLPVRPVTTRPSQPSTLYGAPIRRRGRRGRRLRRRKIQKRN